MWQFLKQQLSWENYQDLDSLKQRVSSIIQELSSKIIRSLTGWDYILEANHTVGLLLRNSGTVAMIF